MDQLRPWVEKNKKAVIFFTTVILVLIIGVMVPGKAGDWVETVGGAALAIGILVTVGITHRPRPPRKRRWPY